MPTERDRLIVDVMGSVGLRPGEALVLQVGDLDPLRATLHIHAAITGSVVSGEELGDTKTEQSTRTVKVPRPLVEEIETYLAGRTEGLLFPSDQGRVLNLNWWRRKRFDPAATLVGLDESTPNTLRHYAAVADPFLSGPIRGPTVEREESVSLYPERGRNSCSGSGMPKRQLWDLLWHDVPRAGSSI